MKLVTRISLLGCLLLALTVSMAAARPAPEVSPGAGVTVHPFRTGPSHANSVCQLGVNGTAAWSVNYLLPPNDAYYTLLDPASCTACGPTHTLALSTAHVALNFINGCAQPVQVGFYGATVGPTGCLAPDLNNLLCPTFLVTLQPGAGAWDIAIPVPSGCCIQGPAFMMINFVANGAGCGTSATRPRLLTIDGCTGCTSYNIYPGGNDDLCDPLIGFPGNPIMYVEADCCNVVPTLPTKWGQLKAMYR